MLRRLTRLELQGYKTFATKTDIEFGDVTCIVGPNGSGETATVRGMVSLPEIAIVPSVGGCGIAIAYFVLGYFPRTHRLMGPGLGQTPRICGTASGWHLCQTA